MSLETSLGGQNDCPPIVSAPTVSAPTVSAPIRALETVRKRLSVSVYVSLRSVLSHLHDGKLTLHGILPSFYIKQVMLSLVEDLREEGVCQILDHTEVVVEAEPHKGPEWM